MVPLIERCRKHDNCWDFGLAKVRPAFGSGSMRAFPNAAEISDGVGKRVSLTGLLVGSRLINGLHYHVAIEGIGEDQIRMALPLDFIGLTASRPRSRGWDRLSAAGRPSAVIERPLCHAACA